MSTVWQPAASWQPLPGGRGGSTAGIWRVPGQRHDWVVKRLRRPGPEDPAELDSPPFPGYWRREAEVALDPPRTHGVVPPRFGPVEEDDEGLLVWAEWTPAEAVPGPSVAAALGRLAASPLPDRPWLSRGLLGTRVGMARERGGWRTLARTTVADLADLLWRRTPSWLERYDALPQVPGHGDPVPANVARRRGEDLVLLDWGQFGTAPAGADLGYFALSAREDFAVLLDTFTTAHHRAGGTGTVADIGFAARLMAVQTVFAQADWALRHAAAGETALAATYRHPAVAPYLRALQRQLPQVEDLLR